MTSNLEAEACLIACLIGSHDKEIASDIFIECKDSDFTCEDYKKIYLAAYKLFVNEKPIDLVTLNEILNDDVRIFTLMVDAIKLIPSYVTYKSYIEIVKKHGYQRQMIELSDRMKEIAEDNPFKARDIVLNELTKIGETTRVMEDMSETIDSVLKEAEERKKGTYINNAIKTPFTKLNYHLNFNAGELYVIAARPGIGKSAFASEILLNSALKYKKSVAFFNLEMSDKEIVKRMFSNLLKVSITDFENMKVDKSKVLDVSEQLKQSQIYINTLCYSIEGIMRACKVQKKKTGLDLVCVDYLQLVGSNLSFKNRNEEVQHVSRQLKILAMELEIPIIALSQMNRAVEQADRPPQLSDLRESGAIEQDASSVIFLYRDSNKENNAEFRQDIDRYIVASIAKNRNGATGNLYLKFEGDRMSFKEIEKDGKLMGDWKPQGKPKITQMEVDEDNPFK